MEGAHATGIRQDEIRPVRREASGRPLQARVSGLGMDRVGHTLWGRGKPLTALRPKENTAHFPLGGIA